MVAVVEKQKGLNFRILAPLGDRRAALTTTPHPPWEALTTVVMDKITLSRGRLAKGFAVCYPR